VDLNTLITQGEFLVCCSVCPSLKGVFVVLQFNMPVVTGSVRGPTILWSDGSVWTSLQEKLFISRFKLSVVTGSFRCLTFKMPSVVGKGLGLKVQDAHLSREFSWSYGSRCPVLQGKVLVLQVRMSIFPGSFRGLTVHPSTFLFLMVQDAHRYAEKKS
jgi:hypothetical protein